jgi:hypothetical protein
MPFLVVFGVLHPTSKVRVQWDLYVLLLLSTVCILTPYMICFDLEVDRVSAIGTPSLPICSSDGPHTCGGNVDADKWNLPSATFDSSMSLHTALPRSL